MYGFSQRLPVDWLREYLAAEATHYPFPTLVQRLTHRPEMPLPAVTIGVGVLAAFVGTGLAAALAVADTKGILDRGFIQIALAAAGVTALEGIKAHR